MNKLTRLQNHSFTMLCLHSAITIVFMIGSLFCESDTIGGQILPTLSLLGILASGIHADYYIMLSTNE